MKTLRAATMTYTHIGIQTAVARIDHREKADELMEKE